MSSLHEEEFYPLIFTQQADENMTMEQVIENVTQQTGGHIKVD